MTAWSVDLRAPGSAFSSFARSSQARQAGRTCGARAGEIFDCQRTTGRSPLQVRPFFGVKLVIQTRRATLAGCTADLREHGALHHLIRSDQRRFGLSAGTGAAINVGSAYRLFFGVVPLRGSSTEGLSGQYTIGATDSYNAKVADGSGKLRRSESGRAGKVLIIGEGGY